MGLLIQPPNSNQVFAPNIQSSVILANGHHISQSPADDYDDDYYDQDDDNFKYGFQYRLDKTKHPKYKTEMCRNLETYGHCSFNGCTFAHSDYELRKSSKQNPKLAK